MRLGLLADVHANLPALDAAIAELERRGVDAWVCAGDLVGFGPHPDAAVARVRELGAVTIAGNHELLLLGHLDMGAAGPMARATLEWSTRVIAAETRAHLAALPLRVSAPGGVELSHGTLTDATVGVHDAAQAAEQLAGLDSDAAGLVLGHTHVAAVHAQGAVHGDGEVDLGAGQWLVNPGSVGQSRSRDPRARCALLDLAARRVTLLSVAYDVERVQHDLTAAGLPPTAVYPYEPRLRRWRRRIRASGRRSSRPAG